MMVVKEPQKKCRRGEELSEVNLGICLVCDAGRASACHWLPPGEFYPEPVVYSGKQFHCLCADIATELSAISYWLSAF